MSEFYQFTWVIRTDNPDQPALAQVVTLEGYMSDEVFAVSEGDGIVVQGPFGTDLCVNGGWAEVFHISSKYELTDNPGPDISVQSVTHDCHGNDIEECYRSQYDDRIDALNDLAQQADELNLEY